MQVFTIVYRSGLTGKVYSFKFYRSSRRAAFLSALYCLRYQAPALRFHFFIL